MLRTGICAPYVVQTLFTRNTPALVSTPLPIVARWTFTGALFTKIPHWTLCMDSIYNNLF